MALTPPPTNDTSPAASYTMPVIHTGYQYSLYGRSAAEEMSYGLDAYIANATKWASTNSALTGALATQAVANANTMKSIYTSNMGSSAIPLVTTTADQLSRLTEMALAAKSLLESPEIDESANAQIASGLSAAMGGGHNSINAIKDTITFDQKIGAKKVALDAYNSAIEAYYKAFTATGATLSISATSQLAASINAIPVVAPFESQFAADVLAGWQDTLNTGQLRDQQIRQTYAAGTALDSFNPGVAFSSWNAEYALAYCGIKSQAAAAKTT